MFEYERRGDRLTLRRPDTRWLSTGFDGGYASADAAHNLTVPKGFERTDLSAYAAERLGSVPDGPTLLTGVEQANARGTRDGDIEVVATAGLSNPAVLPVDGDPGGQGADGPDPDRAAEPGTVNVFVGSAEPLTDGGLAGLLATAVEAKAATLSAVAGCTGTTSDAVVVGCPDEPGGTSFAGSATAIGNAARVCVRDATRAALSARYDGGVPDPEETAHGAVASGRGTPFRP
jgi:adenosylcobinamide hydrolase